MQAYQEAEISAHYVNNYEKAVTAIRRCRQNSQPFVELICVRRLTLYKLCLMPQASCEFVDPKLSSVAQGHRATLSHRTLQSVELTVFHELDSRPEWRHKLLVQHGRFD